MRIKETAAFALAVLCACSTRPGDALALEHLSTRISSLGGDHVAGVIPDLYTDIGVNPAFAFFADRLTVCYARRRIPGYAPSLPYLEKNDGSYYSSSLLANELSAWGIGISSWRMAVIAQWTLYKPETSMSDPSIGIGSRFSVGLNERWQTRDNDYARIDLVAARALGDRCALGLRLRAWGYYTSASDVTAGTTEYYIDPSLTRIDSRSSDTRAQSNSGRRLSFDLQAGIVRSDDTGPRTDLALKVSLNRLENLNQSYLLQISREYDSYGTLDNYYYYRDRWNDARKGDVWDIALTFRHAFDGGVRVLAGGNVSTCSYETEWSSSLNRLRWSPNEDQTILGAFDGDGALLGGSCFVKGSKIFSLHETTDLRIGLHGVFARIRTKEEPIVHYTAAPHGEESTVRIDQPSRLESTDTSLEIYIPISVEFRPSGYFTFFSSFILTGGWDKQSTVKPALSLFHFYPPASVSRAGGANRAGASSQIVIEPETYLTDWERTLSTGSQVVAGFSLHYGARFFVDVYTGTEIIPSYLTDKTIDVRYVF
jgi:hypothetical protein